MGEGTSGAARPDIDVAVLRSVAEETARAAADLVRERRRGGVSVADSKSSPVDVVTEVDRESEAFLRRLLAERRPEDGFLGEEGGAGAESVTGVTWVVDPIDGTVNFLYGVAHWAVSVAAVDQHGESLAGAVVDGVTGEVFTAARGQGATVDGVPLRVRVEPDMAHRLALTGFNYLAATRAVQGAAVAAMLPQVRDLRRMGSSALDLCTIAAGRADFYIEEGLQLWDRAGAGLIATEAGARVEIHPGAGGADCVVAAPEETFDEVLSLVTLCGFLGSGPLGR